jgi:hypothetical protein
VLTARYALSPYIKQIMFHLQKVKYVKFELLFESYVGDKSSVFLAESWKGPGTDDLNDESGGTSS